MNRYIKSLFITFSIYVCIIGALLYSNSINYTDKKPQNQLKETPVKISLLAFQEPKKETIKKEPLEKKEKTKPIKEKKQTKEKKKEIVKKKPTKPIKKIVKKQKAQELQKKKTVVKKEHQKSLKSSQPIAAEKPKAKKEIVKQVLKPTPNKAQIEEQKKAYFSKIKQTIDKNKAYPKLAVRRGIEGLIKVQFVLSHKGELLSYNILEGQRIFKRSVIEAIQKSFPLSPPNNIFNTNIALSLTLDYKLY